MGQALGTVRLARRRSPRNDHSEGLSGKDFSGILGQV